MLSLRACSMAAHYGRCIVILFTGGLEDKEMGEALEAESPPKMHASTTVELE